jgi:hypothetical protein
MAMPRTCLVAPGKTRLSGVRSSGGQVSSTCSMSHSGTATFSPRSDGPAFRLVSRVARRDESAEAKHEHTRSQTVAHASVFTPLAPRRQVPRRLARGRRRLRQVGLSQFLNCERRPATATVPQPRHHIATIAKVISDNETNEGPGFFLLRDEPGANRYPPMTPASPDRSRLPGLGTGDSGGG